jgi:hypothetical protein
VRVLQADGCTCRCSPEEGWPLKKAASSCGDVLNTQLWYLCKLAETPWHQSGSWQPRRRVFWPCVQTGRIRTGPHSQLRYCHFASGDRPAHERFGILALTFWTGHFALSHALRKSSARKSPPSFLLKVCRLLHAAITLVHGEALQIDHWCGIMSRPNQSGCLLLYTSRTDHRGERDLGHRGVTVTERRDEATHGAPPWWQTGGDT